MEGLHLFSLNVLFAMWKDLKGNLTDPFPETYAAERAIENEYYARAGHDIRKHNRG